MDKLRYRVTVPWNYFPNVQGTYKLSDVDEGIIEYMMDNAWREMDDKLVEMLRRGDSIGIIPNVIAHSQHSWQEPRYNPYATHDTYNNIHIADIELKIIAIREEAREWIVPKPPDFRFHQYNLTEPTNKEIRKEIGKRLVKWIRSIPDIVERQKQEYHD